MGNRYGDFYGYTGFFPVIDEPDRSESHLDALRGLLNRLDNGPGSIFSRAGAVHGARLFLIDDIIDNGYPAVEEHLPYPYLALSMTFDGELAPLADSLARHAAADLASIFRHCYGFPAAVTGKSLLDYLQAGQVTTTFLFVDAEAPLPRVLRALKLQSLARDLVIRGQGAGIAERRRLVRELAAAMTRLQPGTPGAFHDHHPERRA